MEELISRQIKEDRSEDLKTLAAMVGQGWSAIAQIGVANIELVKEFGGKLVEANVELAQERVGFFLGIADMLLQAYGTHRLICFGRMAKAQLAILQAHQLVGEIHREDMAALRETVRAVQELASQGQERLEALGKLVGSDQPALLARSITGLSRDGAKRDEVDNVRF